MENSIKSIRETLNEFRDKLYDALLNLKFASTDIDTITPRSMDKLDCIELENVPFVPTYNMIQLKNYKLGIFREDLIKDAQIIELLSDKRVYNIYYFHVWGNILNHRDPPGSHIYLNYPTSNYKTVFIPLQIPSQDANIFGFYVDGQYQKMQEGDIMDWDVVNHEHFCIFDFEKANKTLFKVVHIDFADDI